VKIKQKRKTNNKVVVKGLSHEVSPPKKYEYTGACKKSEKVNSQRYN